MEIDNWSTVMVPDGKKISFYHEGKRPFHQALHVLNTTRTRTYNIMDIFDYLRKSSRPVIDIFTDIKCNIDYETNEAVLPETTSETERVRRSKAIATLIRDTVISRIRKNAFMINPNIIQPAETKNYINAIKKWHILTGINQDKWANLCKKKQIQ